MFDAWHGDDFPQARSKAILGLRVRGSLVLDGRRDYDCAVLALTGPGASPQSAAANLTRSRCMTFGLSQNWSVTTPLGLAFGEWERFPWISAEPWSVEHSVRRENFAKMCRSG